MILIVDDDKAILNAMEACLRSACFQVLKASCPSEVIRLAADLKGDFRSIELMILDFEMPYMNGFALLQQVRKTAPGLPSIMITGHTGADIKRKCDEQGINGYIAKPFNDEQLLKLTREVLSEAVKQ